MAMHGCPLTIPATLGPPSGCKTRFHPNLRPLSLPCLQVRQAKLLFYAKLAEKALQCYERDGWAEFPTQVGAGAGGGGRGGKASGMQAPSAPASGAARLAERQGRCVGLGAAPTKQAVGPWLASPRHQTAKHWSRAFLLLLVVHRGSVHNIFTITSALPCRTHPQHHHHALRRSSLNGGRCGPPPTAAPSCCV